MNSVSGFGKRRPHPGTAVAEAATARVLGSALTISQVIALTGLGACEVVRATSDGGLSWVPDPHHGKVWPSWQFGNLGILDGVSEVVAAFPGVPMGLAHWIARPIGDDPGETPRRMLVNGEVAGVVALALVATSGVRLVSVERV